METLSQKEKARVRARLWAADNRERAKEKSRKWRVANREKHRSYSRNWLANNKERAKMTVKAKNLENPQPNRDRANAWRLANPERIRNNRHKRYGLKPGERDAMFEAQGNRCAICLSLEHEGKNWHTDHCHATGKVRGILCTSCNLMLGRAKDKVETLTSAIAYLQATKAG